MANKLLKGAEVRFFAGVPRVPGRPAMCVTNTVTYLSPRVELVYRGKDDYGNPLYRIVYSMAEVTKSWTECYPEIKEIPAIDPYVDLRAVIGWNSGGNSLKRMDGAGAFRFALGTYSVAVVCGLGLDGYETTPATITHGFHLSNGTLSVWESGIIVAKSPDEYTEGQQLEVSRDSSGVVSLRHGSWVYISPTLSLGSVVLDSSLYVSGDYVEDPVFVAGGSADSDMAIRSMSSDIAGYVFGTSRMPIISSAEGVVGSAGEGLASLAIQSIASDIDGYAYASSSMAIRSESDGGYIPPAMALGAAVMAIDSIGIGVIGKGGSSESSMAIRSIAADISGYTYGSASMAIQSQAIGIETPDWLGEPVILIPMVDVSASGSTVIGDSVSLGISVLASSERNTVIWEPVFIAASVSASHEGETVVGSTVSLWLSVSAQDWKEQRQLLMNLATGAVTQATGLGFDGYVQTPSGTYGYNKTGLYLIEPQQAAKDIEIDLGSMSFGSTGQKGIDLMYVMSDASCAGSAAVSAGEDEYQYPIHVSRDASRVQVGRGLVGREFSIKLRYAGATSFRLDGIRFEVRDTQRIKR